MNLFSLYQYYKELNDKRLVAFKGPFDKYIISAFADFVFKYTDSNMKIFKIFIELAQNVATYSAERSYKDNSNIGIGSLSIGTNNEKYSNYYVFSIGNKIKKEDFKILKEKCNIINNCTKDELRAYKRRERSLMPGKDDNAHIGLIMSSLITNSDLYIVEDIVDNEFYFFTLNLVIEKKYAKLSEE